MVVCEKCESVRGVVVVWGGGCRGVLWCNVACCGRGRGEVPKRGSRAKNTKIFKTPGFPKRNFEFSAGKLSRKSLKIFSVFQ